ncbi:molybdenum ABC transporter ATP-binding protein [Sulfitobacter sp. LCG007]
MSLSVALSHRFPDAALDLAFEGGPGITALFGRSGAGKTTVINIIAGLMRPDRGRVAVNGRVLLDTGAGVFLPAHRRRLGYVFQDARLFPHLDVRQNLSFGIRYAATDRAGPGIGEVADLLGIAALMGRTPATLSGGEKSRVALGRALLSRPDMLLMDEPLASLDTARKQDILPYLERLRDGPLKLPILYVSHSLDEVARLADTLVLIRDGQVAAQGPLFDVLADPAAVPLIGVRDAGAVIEATVLSHASDGLTSLQISAGQIELPGVQAPTGARVRLRVLAQDVILATTRPEGLSSRNILPVTVTAIHPGGGPGAAVALACGSDRLLARVTARAVSEMGLRPGQDCYAIFQATTVAPGSIGR